MKQGICVGLVAVAPWTQRFAAEIKPSPMRQSLLTDSNYFPIAVWVQQPRNADKFKAAGINLFVGLWNGPTEEHLAALAKSEMPVICHQNEAALKQKDNPLILAWMHGDEPDNAQSLPSGKGYGPPILPETIQAGYAKIRAADPSRPVLLNMGQGVAWDNYIGRGVRRNHPEDYPEYIKGADIVSFDMYPAVHDHPDVAGKLEFVARGVKRLVEWSKGEKTVWNCIEASRISNRQKKPTGAQIRSEVWMSLIHGSKGLIYFVHQFEPRFVEASLLEDPELLAAVTAINAEVKSLAHVLNAPSIQAAKTLDPASAEAPVATMEKQVNGTNYLFAVAMNNQPVTLMHAMPEGVKELEVIGKNRTLKLIDGKLKDEFEPYGVHLYRFRCSTNARSSE